MKIFLINILLFLAGSNCIAQTSLPLDERGKYIYYEVVEAKGIAKSTLTSRLKSYFNEVGKKSLMLQSSVADSTFNANGKFIISNSIAMLSHPSGEILYHFVMEIKDGKYRYWLTDFRFIPYQRDRYGNFVPASTASTALENTPRKLNAAEWKNYIEATSAQAKKMGEGLKKYISSNVEDKPGEKKTGTISTKEW